MVTLKSAWEWLVTVIGSAGRFVVHRLRPKKRQSDAEQLISLHAPGGSFSLAEDALAGASAGALTGVASGVTLSLVDDAGGRVALSGSTIVKGATALDYATATSHSFTVRQTLVSAINSPLDTVLTLNVTAAVVPALSALTGTFSLAESASGGALAGVLSGRTTGSTLSLLDDAGGRVAITGTLITRGVTALDYDTASSHSFTVRETLSGSPNSPRDTTFTLTVTNVLEVTLSALSGTFSLAENAAPGAVAGAISGKSSGSSLSLTDDAGGRVALSGSNVVRGATVLDYETATSHNFTVRETHADGSNSPRDTVLSLTVTNVSEGGATPSIVTAPELTGVPRVNEYATIYAGTWDQTITHYQYDVKIDGTSMTGFPTASTTEDAPPAFQWLAAAEDKAYAAYVRASSDNEANWSSWELAENGGIANISTVVTAATRSISATRTSSSGTLPMTFDLSGKRYSSDQWEYVVYDTDGATLLFSSMIGVSEAGLASPFTPDWSGNVDPAPQPPIPNWSTLSATPGNLNLAVRLVSADYMPGANRIPIQGVASNWISLTPTDAPSQWDSVTKASGVTLSGSNLTATRNGGNQQGVRCTRINTGKKAYAEFTLSTVNNAVIAVIDASAVINGGNWTPHSFGGANNSHACSLIPMYGHIDYNATFSTDALPDCVNGDKIQVCHDAPNGKVWFRRNNTGNWMPGGATADPATNTGGMNVSAMTGDTYFALQFLSSGSGSVVANFGGSAFAYTPPTGFGAI